MIVRVPAQTNARRFGLVATVLLALAISIATGTAFRDAQPAHAAQSGWLNPGSAPTGISGTCNNLAGAALEDGGTAACFEGASFKASGFDFTNLGGVPADATNIRLTVRLVARVDTNAIKNTANIRLSWGDLASGTLTANQPVSGIQSPLAQYLLPADGSCSSFDHTWTRAELLAGTFAVRVTSGGDPLYIDAIQVRACWDEVVAPDLTVTKTATVSTVDYGGTFGYDITLKNASSSVSFNSGARVFTETLPSGVMYVSHTMNPATGLSGNISCINWGQVLDCLADGPVTLAAGASLPIRITVTATGTAGPIVNPPPTTQCGIDPENRVAESDELNNGCPSVSVELRIPDLVVALSNNALGGVPLGGAFTWTFTVTNQGNLDAAFAQDAVVLANDLPPGPGYSAGNPTLALAPPRGTGTLACGIATGVFRCTASGGPVVLKAGQSFAVTVAASDVQTKSFGGTGALANPGPGDSCAVDPPLSGSVVESNEANNGCSNTVVVVAPDITIVKIPSATEVTAGHTFSWTFLVTNNGSWPAEFSSVGALVFADTMPAGLTAVGWEHPVPLDIPSWWCNSPDGRDVSCGLQNYTIGPAETVEFIVRVRADTVGTKSYDEDGTSCVGDPDDAFAEVNELNNDCFVNDIEVVAPSGALTVTKTVEWGDYPPDTGATFEICITGPSFTKPDCKDADSDGAMLSWPSLEPGGYTLTETGPGPGWAAVAPTLVTVLEDDEATPTVANAHLAFAPLTLKVICDDDPDVRAWLVTNPNAYDVPFSWASSTEQGDDVAAGAQGTRIAVAAAVANTFAVTVNGVEQASATTHTDIVCNATIAVAKVITNFDGAAIFTVTATPGGDSALVSESDGAMLTVPLTEGEATVTITETAVPGYVVAGWAVRPSVTASCPAAPESTGPVTFDIASADAPLVCLYNEAVGTMLVRNTDATGGGAWGFLAYGPGGLIEMRTIYGTGTATIGNVPLGGPFTVTNMSWSPREDCPVPNKLPGWVFTTQPAGAGGLMLVAPGQVIEFAFTSDLCPVVLAEGGLVIEKVQDIDGDGTRDPGERLVAWEVTVDGPSDPGGAVLGVPAGGLALTDLIAGVYDVVEATRDGYELVGVRVNGGALDASRSASVTVADGETTRVTFFNRPDFAIEVRKTVIEGDRVSEGGGWSFTLSGCGTAPRSVTTNAAGIATFSGLDLPLGCDYSVAEAIQPGWVVAPAAVQLVGRGEPGGTVPVLFTNINTLVVCQQECAAASDGARTPSHTPGAFVSPTRTATTTTTPPAGTPAPPSGTATPAPSGTPGDPTGPGSPAASPADPPGATAPTATATPDPASSAVAGNQGGARSTPAPPAAGNGSAGGSATTVLLAALGILSVSLGLALIGRRR